MSTACVVIEVALPDGEIRRQFGTAFFIDQKHLITAGHNTFSKDGPIKLQIIKPGVSHVNYSKYLNGGYDTIDCTVVGSLYKQHGPAEKDIAILYAGSYSVSVDHFVQLSNSVPQPGDYVDVIGYPGELNTAWMRRQDPQVNDIDESLKAVEKLLPKRTLTVTRGTVKSVGPTVEYNLSTCPGMSGSCVLHKGKVIGIDPPQVKKYNDSK